MAQIIARRIGAVAALALTVALSVSGCGEVARTGRSPAYLVIQRLEAASGAEPDEFGTTLLSDVETIVERQIAGETIRFATVFPDLARVTFSLGLKDPGVPGNPNAPSDLNSVTINQFRVVFRRADGRNTPGVDVPYGFDGMLTVTIPGNATVQAGFEMVRYTSKLEPPLINLTGLGGSGFIHAIAEITFYGRDQAGNEVSVNGSISVTFGDLADPE